MLFRVIHLFMLVTGFLSISSFVDNHEEQFYTSILLAFTPDKEHTRKKAAFLPLSATCPVMTVRLPKWFLDAHIDNQQLLFHQ